MASKWQIRFISAFEGLNRTFFWSSRVESLLARLTFHLQGTEDKLDICTQRKLQQNIDCVYCCSSPVCVVIVYVFVVLCGHCGFFYTLDIGLLARSQY